jgi:hypothetical protein
MLIAPSKVCDIAGSTFENAVVSNDVWTIDDSDIKMVFIDNKNNNYIALQSNDKKLTFEIGSSLFAGINMNTHENLLRNVGLLF